MSDFTAVATCGFGLESVLNFELKKLGMRDIKVSDGRITFTASGEEIARANIALRTAERVLILVARWHAETFDELFDGARAAQLGDIIGSRDEFPVKGYCMNSKLTSVPACQSVLKKACVENLRTHYKTAELPENNGITKKLRFALVGDECTLMLDTSGDGLHKRGYRPLLNEAPIKETLAAGICDLARVFPESHVRDPFCGSGTLVIEAALRAKNIAPGIKRSFAGESYDFLGGKKAFDLSREWARSQQRNDAEFEGRGSDIDPKAVEIARANARRAGVDGCVKFTVADAVKHSAGPDEIVLANPPYGERLMSPQQVERLYADFGKGIFAQKIKGLYIISSAADFENLIGKKAARRRKLYNGMLPCQLYMYF